MLDKKQLFHKYKNKRYLFSHIQNCSNRIYSRADKDEIDRLYVGICDKLLNSSGIEPPNKDTAFML